MDREAAESRPRKRMRPASETDVLRVPPHSVEAEQSVLGKLLLDNSTWDTVADRLRSEDFYRRDHQHIFAAIAELSARGEPSDAVTLAEHLAAKGLADETGGLAYLASLARDTPTAANIRAYADIVRERALLRNLIRVSGEIAASAYDSEGRPAAELVDEAERRVFEIAEQGRRTGSGFVALRDVLGDTIDRLDMLHQNQGQLTGVSTGYHDLDRMTAGLQPGDLVIIAGRPSMGKTAFCLNLIEYATIHTKERIPAAIFSLEMSKEQLVQRMLCSVAKIDASRVRNGKLAQSEFPALVTAAGVIAEAPIYIDDTPAITVLELRAKARRLKQDKQVGMIVVDYLQLMQGSNPESRQQEISEISRSLKALAKELNVPVVALSQLNRSLESRTDKRPILADLRESGAIEQDADVIMFLYRESVYCDACKKRDNSCEKGHERSAEVIIGKQRNGPLGVEQLTFLGEYTRFESQSRRDDDYAA